MQSCNGLRWACAGVSPYIAIPSRRCIHTIQRDGRNRLSSYWTPTYRHRGDKTEDTHELLIRAGYLRQPHSGLFHLLPLGLRVQDKIERLIDKHMRSLGAARVSLSSLTSEDLWRESGRLEGRGSELFHLQDRKKATYLLAPTHEEEITSIVGGSVTSYKDLPLRLYQITRKYRDEARPRQGLLRGREFLMKDLYTFDVSDAEAHLTYESVKRAYAAFLHELGLPYLIASADSGDMGGTLSHEYHFVSENGEDTLVKCTNCGYTANEEVHGEASPGKNDVCPSCNQSDCITTHTAVEIGHTFHLGTRYSEPLNARVSDKNNEQVPISMGCHGIGVSRLIGAVAGLMADKRGLNWPVAIAPFEVAIVSTPDIDPADTHQVYDTVMAESETDIDVAIDDRHKSFGFKLNDADLVGYPIIVVIGKGWREEEKKVEIQCRQLGVNESVPMYELRARISGYVSRLRTPCLPAADTSGHPALKS